MYTFPDVSRNPKGQDGTIIYGNGTSIGSNRIFHYFRENASNYNTPIADLYLINIYTLARNAYQKGIKQIDLEKTIDADSDLYMTYIGAYMTYGGRTSYTRLLELPPVVFFYAPDYSVVPKEYMRVHTGNQLELDSLYETLRKKLPQSPLELTEVPETRKFISCVGRTLFPHKDLIDKIRTIYDGRRTSGSIGTVMISHCPIDFHLYKTIPNLQLLESYTGAVLSVPDFGQKLVKEVKVPFNTTTHRIFGDSVQLEPLVKGRDRTKLIEWAVDSNWRIKTESEIINSFLFKFPSIMASELSILKL